MVSSWNEAQHPTGVSAMLAEEIYPYLFSCWLVSSGNQLFCLFFGW
jgi:hypothetical protein